MSRGPLPSQLYLLSALAYREKGVKVRFLGCVLSYATSTATLKLGHDYPKDSDVTVDTDVRLLLETLNHEDLCVGAWLNIVGYITDTDRRRAKGKELVVGVQALMVWPAGPLNMASYEKSFDSMTDY